MKHAVGESLRSLRARLLTVIVGPLACIAIALAVGGLFFVHSLAEHTSDRVLQGSLAAIAETLAIENSEITLDLPPAAFGMLENAERDNVYYSIRYDGTLLTGYADLASPPASALEPGRAQLRDDVFRGNAVRVAATARRLPRLDEPVVVQVAETMRGRSALERRLATILLTLEVLLVAAAAFLVPPAVAWSLRPVDQLRHDVEARTTAGPVDLSPLPVQQAPREIRPFVGAFNGLLQQLEASTASMRRFTADASHQMRTPLAALRTHLTLAIRAKDHGDQTAAHLREVEMAAGRLERLLTQLLSLARAEERGTQLVLSPVDIARVARDIIAERAPQAVAAGIDIGFDAASPGEVMALGESLLLQEVITNLVDNAIRYNTRGGHVSVRAGIIGDVPHVDVEDDGPGLGARERTVVFRRFARLKRDGGRAGSGLGLAIVQTLVTKMGGQIEMPQKPDGTRGLTVRILLRPLPAAAGVPRPLGSAGSGNGPQSVAA